MTIVAVLDIGKTNVKLCAVSADGRVVDHVSTPNRILPGPPYAHHDLAGLESWLIEALRSLAARYPIAAIVPTAHGGSGVLVGPDGPVMPMIDYELALPDEIAAGYRAAADDFPERGSPIMLGAAHGARQLYWLERSWPEAVARAQAFLPTPQYWSWRLSGVLADEVTIAAAQSHLWCAAGRRPAAIIARRGWERLMAPMQPAYAMLGTILPEIATATGLSPDTRVLCGIHDLSANFYRYQAAGLSDFSVVSTGTWIVGLSDRIDGFDTVTERPGHSVNADITGAPIPGVLAMGGREFAAVAREMIGPANRKALARLVAGHVMALPFFADDDGLAPGRARRGQIVGPLAEGDRFTLAVLYAALLTAEIFDRLPPARTAVLDGSFVREPLYGALVQALRPEAEVLVNTASAGVVSGAALLASHGAREGPVPLVLERPLLDGLPDLAAYRARWLERITLETLP